jgi:hypothetical protein
MYDTNIALSFLLACNNCLSYVARVHEESNYMSPYYSLSAEEKTWEPRFELLLDLSQWSLYDDLNYVSDVATRKMRKGRWKKKHFRNEMDSMEKGYANDMYSTGDFDQVKNKVQTQGRAKEEPKIVWCRW